MRNNDKKNKHMTLDDRIEIQECLNKYTADEVLSRVGEGVYIMFDGFVLYADTDTALEGIALKKGLYFLRDEEGYISKLTVSYVCCRRKVSVWRGTAPFQSQRSQKV